MTHLNASFLVASTDGETLAVGLSENGENVVVNYGTRLDSFANVITTAVLTSIENDTPLIVLVGKNKNRATAGEVFLEGFALDIVRAAVAGVPSDLPTSIAGQRASTPNAYYHPRVAATALPWATKGTPVMERVRRLLVLLSQGDEGLSFIPKGRTHVAG